MDKTEIEALLKALKEKLDAQGRIVDDRLLQKVYDLEKLLKTYG